MCINLVSKSGAYFIVGVNTFNAILSLIYVGLLVYGAIALYPDTVAVPIIIGVIGITIVLLILLLQYQLYLGAKLDDAGKVQCWLRTYMFVIFPIQIIGLIMTIVQIQNRWIDLVLGLLALSWLILSVRAMHIYRKQMLGLNPSTTLHP